ncbi:MAG: molybdate ABC transporter substrate-binding protein [Acidobacteriota bacterium]|nr:molybdate ABC transporter substrate-binding protein [Acidobacteriota bacterium]
MAEAFENRTGIHVVPSFGSTAQLAQQIENGAPYDLFLAADTEHVDLLVKKGLAARRSVYARGTLALYFPKRLDIHSLQDLVNPRARSIIIAKPELAPYGQAAVESLKSLKLWRTIQSKVVYAPNISAAKQYADTGNGDAAFTALALVIDSPKHFIAVAESLHRPIDQAMCIVKSSRGAALATAFENFLVDGEGGQVLRRFGYVKPAAAVGNLIPLEIRGTWVIRKVLPTRTISCLGGKKSQALLGTELEYRPESFRWNTTTVRSLGSSVIRIDARQFAENNSGGGSDGSRVNLSQLGIVAPAVKQIVIRHPDMTIKNGPLKDRSEIPGDVLLVKGPDALVFQVCNVYFEADRKPKP